MNETTIEAVADRLAVTDVALRYARALDLKDWDLFRTCWTDEVETDFSSLDGSEPRTVQAEDVVAFARRNVTGLTTQHLSTNHLIDLDGNEATCVSALFAQHRLPGRERDEFYDMHGDYTYAMRRTPDGWRIRAITLAMRWAEGDPRLLGSAGG